MTRYCCKIRQNGTIIATWGGSADAPTPLLSDPTFSMEVDGSISPLALTIARDFGAGGRDLELGNVVETYAITDAFPDGRLLHAGLLEAVQEDARPDGDTVTVTVTPYVTQLAHDFYRDDAAGTTIYRAFSATDVSTILRTILEKAAVRMTTFARVFATATSIQTSGATVSVEVGSETYLDAIRKVKKLGPGDWYWYVAPDGTFSYRNFDSGTHHTFTVGANVLACTHTTDIRSLVNTVYFWNQSDADGTMVALERPAAATPSQTTYGRRVEVLTDSRIDSTATAQALADAYLREHGQPAHTYEVTVLSAGADARGADIEAIQPGDTCTLRNLPGLPSTPLCITRVDYRPESATLTLSDGPMRRGMYLGMTIEEMFQFLRNATMGSLPPVTTA